MRKLLEDVKETLPARRGFAPWYEKLPADLLAEIVDVKRQWQSGKLPATKTALGASLSKALAARGVRIGQLGVIRWLEQKA